MKTISIIILLSFAFISCGKKAPKSKAEKDIAPSKTSSVSAFSLNNVMSEEEIQKYNSNMQAQVKQEERERIKREKQEEIEREKREKKERQLRKEWEQKKHEVAQLFFEDKHIIEEVLSVEDDATLLEANLKNSRLDLGLKTPDKKEVHFSIWRVEESGTGLFRYFTDL